MRLWSAVVAGWHERVHGVARSVIYRTCSGKVFQEIFATHSYLGQPHWPDSDFGLTGNFESG